ncbi:MAG: bifunctional adenosylcobinamide kinase/adenosylcobinamide-phosphate guanylyltransferase [Caldimicrobium sp.]
MITFVLGGAKSGKTGFALKYAKELKGFKNYYYLATAQALDEEMKEKIEKHQKERPSFWKLIEEPLNISYHLEKLSDSFSVILLDCVTLWVSNILHYNKDLDKETERFLKALKNYRNHERSWLIIISNEIGLGIVPENKLARKYRDLVGSLNQKISALSEEVYFIVAGLPISLKKATSLDLEII